jgi:hypothetical protein
MRILSWNVNGIRAVAKKGFLDWIRSENADIVCIQETKAMVEQVPEDVAHPKGYIAYWSSAEMLPIPKDISLIGAVPKERDILVRLFIQRRNLITCFWVWMIPGSIVRVGW